VRTRRQANSSDTNWRRDWILIIVTSKHHLARHYALSLRNVNHACHVARACCIVY
jgi:hypothetical protein